MKWQDRAAELHAQGKSWREIAGVLEREYNRRFESENVRGVVRRHPSYRADKPEPEDLHSTIRKLLEKPQTMGSLLERTGHSERMVKAALDDIKDAGYQVQEINDTMVISTVVIPTENKHAEDWQGNKIIRFGSVSDTHLCSKWQQMTHLQTMYDIFKSEGIETVYHAGDITEGVSMRQGHEYEVFCHGVDEQTQYVINNYPQRQGITTKFITGNHDHSGIKSAGHDIGKPIANARQDMVYLGMSNAKVELTPNCVLELNHALDGAAYALSYALQKRIDAMSGGEKPSILLDGHHHKMIYLFYRNIHAYEAATFQSQTPWMRGKRLPAHMGGWLHEVRVDDDGTIQRCGGWFFPFYKAIERDY